MNAVTSVFVFWIYLITQHTNTDWARCRRLYRFYTLNSTLFNMYWFYLYWRSQVFTNRNDIDLELEYMPNDCQILFLEPSEFESMRERSRPVYHNGCHWTAFRLEKKNRPEIRARSESRRYINGWQPFFKRCIAFNWSKSLPIGRHSPNYNAM